MEIKDNKLVLDIPEGMEVDVEKSDLKAGVIAFKKSPLSYEDVVCSLRDHCFRPVVLNVTLDFSKSTPDFPKNPLRSRRFL